VTGKRKKTPENPQNAETSAYITISNCINTKKN